MGCVLGSVSQLRALMTELETATPRPRHLFPSRCMLGSAARMAAEAPAIIATGSEWGEERSCLSSNHVQSPGCSHVPPPNPGRPWEAAPDQGTCSHSLVGSCLPGGGPPGGRGML